MVANENVLLDIVKKVLAQMEPAQDAAASGGVLPEGVFGSMEKALEASVIAQKQYMQCSLNDRARFLEAIRKEAGTDANIETMSRMAVEETGMGNFEHKCMKNRLAIDKTPGLEDLHAEAITGDDGLTLLEYSPFGVIGAITPTTNPSETILCNSIGMLAGGNSVVFSPHPRAAKTSHFTVALINKALREAGAPPNLVTTIANPSLEEVNVMLKHPDVRMLVATGGPGAVNAVLTSGKKAIGAGAGNPPVLVDETADIEKAAKDIMDGCSFDNNLPCTCEKEVVVVDSVADYLIFNMKKNGGFEIDPPVVEALLKLVTNEKGHPKPDFVGKSAKYLLEKVGVQPESDTRVIIFEADKDHPFVMEEMMMPILPIVRVQDVDEGIDLSVKLEQGCRHTAIMHSKNVDKLTKMAKLIQTTIFVKNGPSYAGIGVGGEGYGTFTIAGPTGEGLTSPRTFCRRRRCVLVGGFDIK
ncbi:MAG: aldehyde dehydrogenase family protein [Bacillota bacterium]